MNRSEKLIAVNWGRMRRDIERASLDFRRTADLLDEIDFNNPQGERRSPESIISQAALVMNTSAPADLVHRLALWAEEINDLHREPIEGPE